MRIAVIGAGASGLFVAGFLAQEHEVVVFDKNEKVGKKLYITGKGRCNITNLTETEEFLKNVVRGEKFLRSSLSAFSSYDCVDFFEGLGLKTKVERGNRVFPQSDKSSDVIKVLKERHCKNVEFLLDNEVFSVEKQEESLQENSKFVVKSRLGQFEFDKVIVATGGVSYKATGSDGSGYKIAKKFGHFVEPLVPALCALKISDWFVGLLQGVSLKNVELKVVSDGKKKGFFGEMLFTDEGISGPIVLTASSFINRAQNVEVAIDFKPALSNEQLDLRLLRDFEENRNKEIKSVVRGLLPKAVAEVFVKVVGLYENQKVNSITKQERLNIVNNLKNFKLSYGGLYDINSAIITSGGVSLKEINPKTFESKLQSGLYFVGEVLDVDALTGGFNLQIAWATAFSCARNI